MRQSILASMAAFLVVVTFAFDANAGANPKPQALLHSVQELGISLHQSLHCDLTKPTAPQCPSVDHAELERRLNELADSAVSLPDEWERKQIEAKLEQLRGLLYNLDLVTNDPKMSLGLPTTRPEDVGGTVETATNSSPANDGCSSPLPMDLGFTAGDTTDAGNDGQASCGASMFSPDVWFEFTAPYDGLYYANTIGSNFDTVLSTHGGCPGTITNQIDCNDDHFGLMSSIRLDLDVGETILIRLAGAGGATGDYVLHIQQDARIGGRITEANGGAPIEYTRAKVFNQDGVWVASGQSDSNGDYLVTGLNQDEVFICTDSYWTNYIDELHENIGCPRGAPYGCDPTSGNPVNPHLNNTITIDFALDEESTVSGTITEVAGGSPTSSASVVLYSEDGEFVNHMFTDQSGNFTIRELPAGIYFAVGGGYIYLYQLWDGRPCAGWGSIIDCDPTTGDPITVPAATAVTGIDFQLQQWGIIYGTITEAATGLPIQFAHVSVENQAGYHFVTTVGHDGSYGFGALQPGSYFVNTYTAFYLDEVYDGIPCEVDCDPFSGTPIEVIIGSTTTGIDIDLVRLGSIRGTVTDAISGLPIVSAWVQAFDSSGHQLHGDYTDTAGNYYIVGLMPGDHYVATDADTYAGVLYDGIPCPFECDPTSGTPVTIQMATTSTGIDFVLEPMGGISGTVIDDSTSEPLEGTWIEVWHQEAGYRGGVDTNVAGQFEIDELPAGTYYVATNQNDTYLDELYNGFPCWGGPPQGCDPTKGTPITVSAGAITSSIDIGLTDLLDVIFTDGFESGFTGAWSETFPP